MKFIPFSLLLIVLTLMACGVHLQQAPLTLDESAYVTRDLDGTYTLNFAQAAPRTIFTGDHPETIDWEEPFATATEPTVVFDNLKAGNRVFFGVKNSTGKRLVLSERRIPMKKQPNFRDIGGIPTKDGHRVKWGTFYRSGKLSKLKKDDLAYFSDLGIEKIYDFRNDIEVADDPDRYPAEEGVEYVRLPIGDPAGEEYEELVRQLRKGEIEGEEMKVKFEEIMTSFADTLAEDFKPLLDQMVESEGDTPILYHCSGGKDRTGFATALILATLGVERDTIFDEYLMSNYYRYNLNKRNMSLARFIGIKPETSQYAFLVHEDYLQAAFEVIDEEYGGMDNYLEEKFGITPEVRAELKEKYTF